MKKYCFTMLLLVVTFCFTGFTFPEANGIIQFEWLLGSWQGKAGKGMLHESWRKYDENTLVGEGYFIANSDTVVKETLRIQRIGKFWTYIAVVNKNEPVLFTLQEADNQKWVFGNKEHDFPQRVVYQRLSANSLLAYIEGTKKSKMTREEYKLHKVQEQ